MIFIAYELYRLQQLVHFNTTVNDMVGVFSNLSPDERYRLALMGAAVLLYLVILAWRAALASRRGEEINSINKENEAYKKVITKVTKEASELRAQNELFRERIEELEDDASARNADQEPIDQLRKLVTELTNAPRSAAIGPQLGSYDGETLEDSIARLERTASDLGRSVTALQGRADGAVQESRVRSLTERLRELHGQALTLSNRNSAVQTLLLEADNLKERIEEQMEEIDHENTVDKVQELDKFAFDQTTSMQQIERVSDQLESIVERLQKLDTDAASMLTGDGSVVEQLRLAERLVAMVKARVEPLQASQNGNRADIGARIIKAGQDTASLETSLDRLDLATSLKQIEALSTRLAALHVQITGQQPKLTVVNAKVAEPAAA